MNTIQETDKNLYNFKATLKRVIDGDTIEVIIDLGFDIHFTEKVRVARIDTPEIRVSYVLEKKCGYLVKDYVESLLKDKQLYLKTYKNHEKYDRYNAEVKFIHPDYENQLLDLSTHLLNYNLAHVYDGGKKEPWEVNELKEIQKFFGVVE